MKRLRLVSAILFCLLVNGSVRGQTSQPSPTTAAADQIVETDSIRSPEGGSDTSRTSAVNPVSSGMAELSRIAIALLVVITLILILRGVVRHLTAMPGTNRSGKLVTVLSRSAVSPKQQVLVLQFGKRLIVVGDSGGHMSALCEVSDPDEVAAIIGQSRSDHESRADRTATASFNNLFRRANEPFSEPAPAPGLVDDSVKNVDAVDTVSAEEVGGLLEKIRMLQQQFKQT